MKYFLDTEFNGFYGELISLALVAEDGRELYVATDCPHPEPWVGQNVIPIITARGAVPVYSDTGAWGRMIADFMSGDQRPWVISDWPDDLRHLCSLVITGPGEMVSLPSMDMSMLRIDAYPTTLKDAVQHNALWDARALRQRVLGGTP